MLLVLMEVPPGFITTADGFGVPGGAVRERSTGRRHVRGQTWVVLVLEENREAWSGSENFGKIVEVEVRCVERFDHGLSAGPAVDSCERG